MLKKCWTSEELSEYIVSETINPKMRREIASHLNSNKCPRCRRIFQILENQKFIKSGQIWSTSVTPRNMLGEIVFKLDETDPVLVTDYGNGVKSLNNMIGVIPLSFDLSQHIPGETLIIGDFLLEIFHKSPMLAGNLSQHKSDFSRESMEEVRKAISDWYKMEETEFPPAYLNWKKERLKWGQILAAPVNESL